jgi:hypothetical protein
MTDYTNTPNLGLYKPTNMGDTDSWGLHLNANADLLDAAVGTGGPYLPLSGGTLTGSLTLVADPAAALQAATRQYVDNKVAGSVAGVSSFNTRTGAVALSSGDVTTALAFTPVSAASPTFTGTVTAPVVNATTVRETVTSLIGNVIDLSQGTYFTKTITGATALTVANLPPPGSVPSFILELTNGGSAPITWWYGVTWAGGVPPVLSVSGVDILGFYTLTLGTPWRGLLLSKGMA